MTEEHDRGTDGRDRAELACPYTCQDNVMTSEGTKGCDRETEGRDRAELACPYAGQNTERGQAAVGVASRRHEARLAFMTGRHDRGTKGRDRAELPSPYA
ncbi:MAG: hypothetical protein AB7T06_44590, partial [Kofleriaceae bacterium]